MCTYTYMCICVCIYLYVQTHGSIVALSVPINIIVSDQAFIHISILVPCSSRYNIEIIDIVRLHVYMHCYEYNMTLSRLWWYNAVVYVCIFFSHMQKQDFFFITVGQQVFVNNVIIISAKTLARLHPRPRAPFRSPSHPERSVMSSSSTWHPHHWLTIRWWFALQHNLHLQ